MFHLKRSPEFEKIVPIFAVVFLRNDGAIAQTIVQPQPQIQVAQPSGDYTTSIVLSVVSAVGVVSMAGFQLITRIGANAVDNRTTKIKQELAQDAAINSGYVSQSGKSFDAILLLLNTAIANVLQSSRDAFETFTVSHDLVKRNSDDIKELKVDVLARLALIECDIQKILGYEKDIMNVLRMKDREGG